MSIIGPGTTPGTLFDLGTYPGAVFGPTGTVHGTVFELPLDDAVLAAFDAYEGVPDLYVRLIVPVALTVGRELPCWAYQYNGDPAGRQLIPSGLYRPLV